MRYEEKNRKLFILHNEINEHKEKLEVLDNSIPFLTSLNFQHKTQQFITEKELLTNANNFRIRYYIDLGDFPDNIIDQIRIIPLITTEEGFQESIELDDFEFDKAIKKVDEKTYLQVLIMAEPIVTSIPIYSQLKIHIINLKKSHEIRRNKS